MSRLVLIIALLGLALPVRAQEQVDVISESRFWIEGSSFATRFTCRVDGVNGHGRFSDDGVGSGTVEQIAATGELTVLISRFDCGLRPMTKDLRETLKGKQFPEITFNLISASTDGQGSNGVGSTVTAIGDLTIAGQTRRVDMTGSLSLDDHGHYQVSGSRQLLLTDFGMDPPTKMLGLIKVRNEIDVFFDLVASPRTAGQVPDSTP